MKTKTLFFSSLVAAAAMSTVPAFAEDTATADSVLINFNSGKGTSTAEGTWNDTTAKAGTSVALVDSTGAATDMTATWTATGMWRISDTVGNILNGYLDDNNNGTNVEITIGVSNVSYLAYDVSIYCATDKGSSFSAKTVNGSTYTYSNGATIIGDTSWGTGSAAGTTIAEGTTYFTISGLFGDLSISSRGDNVGNDGADKTRGSIAAVTIVDTSVKYSPALAGASDLTWTSTALAGGEWKNASAQNGWSYADMTLSVDTSISVSDTIDTIAVFTSGTGALTLNGSGAINMLLGSQIKAGSGTSIDIQNTVNFANGGTLSGTVTTSGNGVLKVVGGTLDAAALAATAPSLKVSLESGATYAMDLSSAAANHDLSKVSGESGSVISIAGNSSPDTFTGISALSSEFKGAVKITSGFLNLASPALMNNSGVEKIILSGGTASGLCFLRQSVTISKDIVAEGNGGALRSYGNNSYSVEFTGNVSGTSIRHYDGGTHTFSGTVNLTSFTADAGVTNFSGTGTKTITTLKQSGGTVNFSGKTALTNLRISQGTVNVSSVLNVSGSANNVVLGSASFFLNESQTGTLNVNSGGVVNVNSAHISVRDGTGTLNVETGGEINFGTGLNVTKNGNWGGVIFNLNGGRLNVGSSGIQRPDYSVVKYNFTSGTIGSLADSWSSSENLTFGGAITIDTAKKTINENGAATDAGTGSAITISGVISGAGSLTKTGAGTLTLSGANTFTGGVNINAGKVVANNASALGAAAGNVEIAGGQLEIGSGITLVQTNITIALSDAYSTTAAILGEGALADGTTITLTKAEEAVITSLVEKTKEYQIFANGTSLASNFSLDSFKLDEEAWAGWKISNYDTGTGKVTLEMIPEPSAFGLLAGVGALVFVAARRRRRAK